MTAMRALKAFRPPHSKQLFLTGFFSTKLFLKLQQTESFLLHIFTPFLLYILNNYSILNGAKAISVLQNFKIEPQDRLEVKGSMIHGMEEPMFIATEVKKGDQVLKLRDDTGYPVWAPPRKKHEK